MTTMPLLSIIIFLPLLGATALLFFSRRAESAIKGFALGVSLLDFLVSLGVLFSFQSGTAGFQLEERVPWIAGVISYHVGIDGISLWLVMLTTMLTPIAILASFGAITSRVKEYMILFLLLETAMLGTFLALDLFLFYVFWEAVLIPMALIIGVWGTGRRIYSAVKFFLFTMAGSVLMLVAIIALFFIAGGRSFDLTYVMGAPLSPEQQLILFLAFAIAFAIKVPMFPFHTWLPDAHVDAPTAGSVILAAILLKMGTYGFLRFCLPLFPAAAAQLSPLILTLAVIGIIYGAVVATVQPDMKKLVAYSSVSHLGFVMLGLFAFNMQGLQGSLIQMVNHGVSTGALFLIVGILYERAHTRLIAEFGGVARLMPVFAAFFLVMMFSSAGLPGTNGFIGEFLILLGAFRDEFSRWWAVAGATGVILAAVYLLWWYQRVMQGPVKVHVPMPDLQLREVLTLVPLVILVFWIGLYPNFFFSRSEASLQAIEQRLVSAMAERPQPLTLLAPWGR